MLQMTLIYGFINSAILVVVALGFNITFGISGVANFSHGALYVGAGFLAFMALKWFGMPYWVAAPLTVMITAGVAALTYRFIILRVRGLVVSEVIATFAVGLAILELFRYFGFVGFEYTLPAMIDSSVAFGDTVVDAQRLVIVVAGGTFGRIPLGIHPFYQDGTGFSRYSPGRANFPDLGD